MQGCFSMRPGDPGEDEAVERRKVEIVGQVSGCPVKVAEVEVGALQPHYLEVWPSLVSRLWQEGQGVGQLEYQAAA